VASSLHGSSLALVDLNGVNQLLEISKERICQHRGGVGLSQAKMMRILIVEDEEHPAVAAVEQLALLTKGR
jgi:hypothetical protein